MRKFFALAAAALVVGLTAGTASAGPFYTMEILGSSDGGVTYTNNLQVAAGTTYDYEVLLQQTSTFPFTNTASGTKTVTSIQGMNSFSLNVNDTSAGPITVNFTGATLSDGWANGTGPSSGTQGTGITNNRGIQGLGVLNTGGSMLTGQFTTASGLGPDLTEVIQLAFGGTTSTFKYNNNVTATSVNPVTESSSDPYIVYQNLTLTTPSVSVVPEPASVVMLGLGFVGVAGLMVVRRRRMA